MFPLLGLGKRLYPGLDTPYITNPDGAVTDPFSASDLRKAWTEVNRKLTAAFERFTPEDWLKSTRQSLTKSSRKIPRATALRS